MKEGNLVKLIEIRTNQGELLGSLKIKEVRIESKEEVEKDKVKAAGDNTNKGSNPESNEDLMSFAQKRYLFRLLAEQGIEGDEAHENLKERFKVDSLKDVTKVEASQVIERLLEEQKGGDDHGSSK